MIKVMKCPCGNREPVTPKIGQRLEEYLQSKKCPNCNNKGNWNVLSVEEPTKD